MEIAELPCDPYVRVAIDGVDGAGKTIFANELGEVLANRGRNVVRAGIDNFHTAKAIRPHS